MVDSTSVSIGTGWLVQHAAELARAERSAGEIVDAIREMIPRLRLTLTLETLEYLQRGGRIGRAQAFLGGLLNVKPVLEVRDGEVRPVERVRTRAGALRRVAEITRLLGPKAHVCVVHGACEEDAEAFCRQVAAAEGHRGHTHDRNRCRHRRAQARGSWELRAYLPTDPYASGPGRTALRNVLQLEERRGYDNRAV